MSDKFKLKKFIRKVDDFPIEGIVFRDITSLIETPEAFVTTCEQLTILAKLFDNPTFTRDFDLEYGSTSIEIQKNTILNKTDRVVIVDDLVATGGTAIACAELITENFDITKENILILAVIDLPNLGGSNLIKQQGYKVETLVSY